MFSGITENLLVIINLKPQITLEKTETRDYVMKLLCKFSLDWLFTSIKIPNTFVSCIKTENRCGFVDHNMSKLRYS